MRKRIVISGLSALSARGHNIASICDNASKPTTSATRLPLTADLSILPISELDVSSITSRLRKKLDPFVQFGLYASKMALEDSGVLDAGINCERIGIFIGNCLGGWAFTEPELKKLHTMGVEAMSPYVATAWFPAALQGQISLQYNFKGYSKTFSASAIAGVQAIGYAVEAIQKGRVDVVLCGAAEDLSSPYSHAMLSTYDYGVGDNHSVFGPEKYVDFEEGAAFLVLESYEHAVSRGAKIYCEISGFADHFCATRKNIEEIQKNNLLTAINRRSEAQLLILDGLFSDEENILSDIETDLETTITKASSRKIFGNMFAVSGVAELVCSAYWLRSGAISNALFDGKQIASPSENFKNVLVRRLSKQGGISTLSLSAI